MQTHTCRLICTHRHADILKCYILLIQMLSGEKMRHPIMPITNTTECT